MQRAGCANTYLGAFCECVYAMQEAPSVEKTCMFSCGESGLPEAVRRIKGVHKVSGDTTFSTVLSCTECVLATGETFKDKSCWWW